MILLNGGDELGTVDWGQIEAAGLDKTTMVIFTNTKDLLSGFEVKYGSAMHVMN